LAAVPWPLAGTADPSSVFAMTGIGSAVARAIVVLSSSPDVSGVPPGSPGWAPDLLVAFRCRFVVPA
jgi:hypothetical protein